MIRWIGFVFIILGASVTGMTMAANVKRNASLLRQFVNILCEMRGEIEFHLTPLGELCGIIADKVENPLKAVFGNVCERLYAVPGRPVGIQMREALCLYGKSIEADLKKILTELFDSLGKQDVYAQLRALDLAQSRAQFALDTLEREKGERCKAYRVISICAGIATAVILI